MQKWEYLVAMSEGYGTTVKEFGGDWITYPTPPTGVFRATKGYVNLSQWLNKVGEDGWEIAGMTAVAASNLIVLKRPKQ